MDNKKNSGRFSIYFNIEDKRHIEAIGILRGKGRKKAQYLADAILFYDSVMTGSYKEKYITACIEDMQEQQKNEGSDSLTPEAASAIIGSLGAFKKKG